MFPRSFRVFLPFLALGLSGCAAQNQNAAVPGVAVRGVAASFVAARAFDRAHLAIARGDNAELQSAGRDLRRAASAGSNPQLASALVRGLSSEAGRLFEASLGARGEEKIYLAETSNARYRAALAVAPQDSPEKTLDPRTLNALGYFLADHGSSREDFLRAAILTRAAYQNWDVSGRFSDSNELTRAVLAQDSYAWALFKLGKYRAARVQSEKVWELAQGMGAADLTGEIPYHLGEIYRALGLEDRARESYEAALGLTLSEEAQALVRRGLKSLDLARA